MPRSLSCFLCAALFGTATAQTLVIPSAVAGADGNSSTSYPFDVANGRFLYIYDSSHFTGNGVTFPILISQIRYRANATTTTWTGATPTVTMELSTAPIDHLAISTTWNNNHGVDRAVVHNGPLSIPGGSSTTGTPGPFYATIAFAAPFLYDPNLGDLTIDVTSLGNTTANVPTLDAVTTAGITGANRVYSVSNPPAATATLWSGEIANVLEFTYTPASGLYPDFTADQTAGNSPQTVNFTDSTYSSAPGGVSTWAWDFNGDSVIDSALQNPSFVYTQCGTFTVSLTVTDSLHPAATATKTGYIVIDQIVANFTASTPGGFAPLNVSFTDTSTGPVTGWAWDFDGDNIIDANVPNPNWVYATPGIFTVSLTVTNACRTNTRTRANLIGVLAPGGSVAAPERLQYQFNEVRGTEVGNSASTNVAPAQGIANNSTWQTDPGRAAFRGNEPGFGCLGYRGATGSSWVDTGMNATTNGSFSVAFWLQRDLASTGTNPFGYVFGDGTFRAFCAGAAGQGVTFRGSSVGNVDSVFPVTGTPGVWQHLVLVVDDAQGQALWYDNGVASTNVVSFTPGTHTWTTTNALSVGANGSGTSPIGVHYSLDDFRFYSRALLPVEVLLLAGGSEQASAGVSGLFCNGPGGTPSMGAIGAPAQGNAAFAVTLTNAEDARLAVLALGFTPAAFGLFDLSPWIGPGCVLQHDAVSATFYVTVGGAATQPFPIPASGFAGLHVYGQWAVLGTVGAATRMLDINVR